MTIRTAGITKSGIPFFCPFRFSLLSLFRSGLREPPEADVSSPEISLGCGSLTLFLGLSFPES